jgi:hypothetical protein
VFRHDVEFADTARLHMRAPRCLVLFTDIGWRASPEQYQAAAEQERGHDGEQPLDSFRTMPRITEFALFFFLSCVVHASIEGRPPALLGGGAGGMAAPHQCQVGPFPEAAGQAI